MRRPSTYFATAFAFVVALAGVWLGLMFIVPSMDSEWATLLGVIVGAFFAFRVYRRIAD